MQMQYFPDGKVRFVQRLNPLARVQKEKRIRSGRVQIANRVLP